MNQVVNSNRIDTVSLSDGEKTEVSDYILECYLGKREIEENIIIAKKEIKYFQCCGQNCSDMKEDLKNYENETKDALYIFNCWISMCQELLE